MITHYLEKFDKLILIYFENQDKRNYGNIITSLDWQKSITQLKKYTKPVCKRIFVSDRVFFLYQSLRNNYCMITHHLKNPKNANKSPVK